jgi:hypothetical protein
VPGESSGGRAVVGVEEQDDDLGGLSMDENYSHKPRSDNKMDLRELLVKLDVRGDPIYSEGGVLINKLIFPKNSRDTIEKIEENIISNIIISTAMLHLQYSENPLEDGISGQWKCIDSDFWAVPSDVNVSELIKWLYFGNWVIYEKRNVNSDVWRMPSVSEPAKIVESVLDFGIQWALYSFHDNSPWFYVEKKAERLNVSV